MRERAVGEARLLGLKRPWTRGRAPRGRRGAREDSAHTLIGGAGACHRHRHAGGARLPRKPQSMGEGRLPQVWFRIPSPLGAHGESPVCGGLLGSTMRALAAVNRTPANCRYLVIGYGSAG